MNRLKKHQEFFDGFSQRWYFTLKKWDAIFNQEQIIILKAK